MQGIAIRDLQRPVSMAYGDINKDGWEDVVACEFGNETGKLSLYENNTKGGYTKRVLRNKPGAITAVIEDANNVKSEISKTITLISATKNKFNLFNSTIVPFDPNVVGNWNTLAKQRKDLMFTSFSANIPNSKIDSVSSSVFIDGVQFDKYKITVTVNNSVLFNSFLLSTIHKGYDFGITYVYVDKATKNEIETMLNKAKFNK